MSNTTMDMLEMPALTPPVGMESEFSHPITLEAVILGIAVATSVLMVIAVSIRTYTKAVLLKEMNIEECQCGPT
jgi:hypothetical protein